MIFMRKQFLFSATFAFGLLCSSCASEHYVAAPPPPPEVVVVKPVPGRVWVDYDYRWRRGKYVAVPGHWIKVKTGRTWVPGHWEQRPRGQVWIPGHWK